MMMMKMMMMGMVFIIILISSVDDDIGVDVDNDSGTNVDDDDGLSTFVDIFHDPKCLLSSFNTSQTPHASRIWIIIFSSNGCRCTPSPPPMDLFEFLPEKKNDRRTTSKPGRLMMLSPLSNVTFNLRQLYFNLKTVLSPAPTLPRRL